MNGKLQYFIPPHPSVWKIPFTFLKTFSSYDKIYSDSKLAYVDDSGVLTVFDVLSRNSTKIHRNSTFVSIYLNYWGKILSNWEQIFAEAHFVFQYDFQIKLSSNLLQLSPNLTYLLIADSQQKPGGENIVSSYTLINIQNR